MSARGSDRDTRSPSRQGRSASARSGCGSVTRNTAARRSGTGSDQGVVATAMRTSRCARCRSGPGRSPAFTVCNCTSTRRIRPRVGPLNAPGFKAKVCYVPGRRSAVDVATCSFTRSSGHRSRPSPGGHRPVRRDLDRSAPCERRTRRRRRCGRAHESSVPSSACPIRRRGATADRVRRDGIERRGRADDGAGTACSTAERGRAGNRSSVALGCGRLSARRAFRNDGTGRTSRERSSSPVRGRRISARVGSRSASAGWRADDHVSAPALTNVPRALQTGMPDAGDAGPTARRGRSLPQPSMLCGVRARRPRVLRARASPARPRCPRSASDHPGDAVGRHDSADAASGDP